MTDTRQHDRYEAATRYGGGGPKIPVARPDAPHVRWPCRWLARRVDQRVAWSLCAAGAIAVLYGSLTPALAPPDLLHLDKAIHLLAYGGLATVGFLPVEATRRGWPLAAM